MTPLEELLQKCTVKITVPGGWGTGFFVATGLILTCAHVVRKADDLQVTVFYPAKQQSLSAIVKSKADDGKTLDLALVELSEPLPDHPCVLLDDEPVAIGQALYSYGYLESYTNAAPVRPVNEGLTGDMPPLLKLQGAQIEKGISGAALLNLKTGKVCGMVKETRAAGFDLGGGAIPTRVILEQFPELRELQQAFHGGDRRWEDLITKQPKIDFQPYLQAILANEDYREWQEVYTPTTVEDRWRVPVKETSIASQQRFSSRLKLRAEIVKPDKKEQGDQPDKVQEPQDRVEQWDVLAGLRNYATDHVVLIGKPGSGKSTSLERLLWEEAEKALQDPKARIPVLVKLRRCTGTIEALIRDFLVGHQVALELVQIEELLRQGRFLLLLDGLNELPKDFEIEVFKFRDRYRRTTPMIVSTRDLGGGGTLGIEKTLKMLPLTEPQMRKFVKGYLPEEGDRLFQQLQGDRLRKFAETPLLLWMLCRVFAEECIQAEKENRTPKLPENLGFAFREFTRLYDQGTDEHQAIQEDAPVDSRDQWHKLLRHLAFVMMQGKTLIDPQLSIPREEAEDCLTAYLRQEHRSNPRECAEQWLKDLLKYHLIQPVIQPNFEEHIEFRHQLIQEYYAAECLLKRLPNLTDEQLKRDYLNYLKWTEPIALMLALVAHKELAVRVVEQALDMDLMLGARLAGEVKPEFQAQTVKFVEELEVPDWLKVQLLGETRSDFVLNALCEVLQDKNHCRHMRKSAAFALSKLRSDPALKAIKELKDEDPDLYRSVVLSNPDLEPDIFEFLRSSRNDASYSLCVPKETLEELGSAILGCLRSPENSSHDIYEGTVSLSRRLVAEEIKKLENPDEKVRRSAADTLGNSKAEEAIPALSKVLKEDSSWEVRRSAASALGQIGSKQVIPILLNVIESSDVLVAGDAAKALGQIDSDDTIPALLKALESGNPEVRLIVAYKLSGIKSNCIASILPDLFKLLSTQSGEDAFDAIQGIQVNCKFYNYDLYPAYLAAQKGDPPASQSDKPTNVFNIRTLHAPGAAINLGGTIQGDQIGAQPHPPEL